MWSSLYSSGSFVGRIWPTMWDVRWSQYSNYKPTLTRPRFSISVSYTSLCLDTVSIVTSRSIPLRPFILWIAWRSFLKAFSWAFQLQSPATANPGTLVTLALSLPLNAWKKLESKVQQPSRSRCDLQTLFRQRGCRISGKNKAFTSLNEVVMKQKL